MRMLARQVFAAVILPVAMTAQDAPETSPLREVWSADLGSVTYSQPAVANGKVFIGTNNERGYVSKYPADVDLGVMLAFDLETGDFLWQQSHEKLPTGRRHDWPLMGITSSPTVNGEHLYYVSNRAELVCLKTNSGELVWTYDMMGQLDVSPHGGSCSQPAVHGDLVFVVTGNGVGPSHTDAELNAEAPSFIAVDKTSGQLVWSDASPGGNVLHGQWSSPIVIEVAGRTQAIFPGGDGWIYSFDVAAIRERRSETLLWKFDANPKTSLWRLGGRGDRNHVVAPPTFANGLVYIVLGQDPEHGDGIGGVVCIDPTGRGDVSEELVFNKANPDQPIAHKRRLACEVDAGDFTRPNKNSKLVWRTSRFADVPNSAPEHEQHINRSIGSAVISGDLLFVADFTGLVHCLDAHTGTRHWTHDTLSQIWVRPIAIGPHLYVATEDGDLYRYTMTSNRERALIDGDPETVFLFDTSVEANMTYADGKLFVASRKKLRAFEINRVSQAE